MNSPFKQPMTAVCLSIWALLAVACSGPRKSSEPQQDYDPIVKFVKSIDYADTATLHSDKAMRRLIHDLVILMKATHPDSISKALEIFINGIKDDEKSLLSADRYAFLHLGNPNSRLRNENDYIAYLEVIDKTPGIPEGMAETSKEKLRKVRLNRVGSLANDFRYIDRNGKEGSLHHLKADRTMLIFYDPLCPHCTPILKKLATSPEVNKAIRSGKLTVLAVYTEGNRELWEKTKRNMPKQWTVAYDLTEIVDREIYDIPAMPTVYILDAGKHVVIKDMPL